MTEPSSAARSQVHDGSVDRTEDQARDDMVKYGACPLCGTARTARLSTDKGVSTLSMVCPGGCEVVDIEARQDSGEGLTVEAAAEYGFSVLWVECSRCRGRSVDIAPGIALDALSTPLVSHKHSCTLQAASAACPGCGPYSDHCTGCPDADRQ